MSERGSGPWTNWAGNQVCAPASMLEPGGEAEIVHVVERATASGQTVKCVGAGHSFTPIVCTGGVMLDLRRCDRVLAHAPDARTLTVEAGMSLGRLSDELDRRGLALENMGDIAYQSVGGAIATGTHGAGWHFGNISSRVVGLRMVAADGSILDASTEENPICSPPGASGWARWG